MDVIDGALGFLRHQLAYIWPLNWLESIRIVANFVIVVANLRIAHVLFTLYRQKRSYLAVSRMIPVFAVLITVCALAHFCAVFDHHSYPRPAQITLKVLAALFWIACAVRLPGVVTHLLSPPPMLSPLTSLCGDAVTCPRTTTERASLVLAFKVERLRIKARMLRNMLRNESWILNKTEALRELKDILADLEAEQCKT